MTLTLTPTGTPEAPAAQELPGGGAPSRFVSVDDLAAAYRKEGRPQFVELRAEFQQQNGEIVESYFAQHATIGVVLVRVHRGRRSSESALQLHVADAGPLPCPLADLVRTVLHEKHRLAGHVQGRAHDIVVHDAYSLIVYLLTTAAASHDHLKESAIRAATKTVKDDLDRLAEFTRDTAHRTALCFYLMGLTIGAVVGMGLIVAAYQSSIVDRVADGALLAACLTGGAFGAVISVMVRVTRGTTLEVDSMRGRMALVLAGSFRPVIGAVFGAVLLVLTNARLLPFSGPIGPAIVAQVDQTVCFFIGLAFLAGFSERWAQDTIVSSAPKVPPAQRSDMSPEADSA